MTRLYKDKVFLSYPDIRALFLSISVLIPDESLNLPYIKIEK